MLENVTPEGKVEGVQPLNAVFENVGAGLPDAVAWKLPALPTKKLVELALVIAGAWLVVPELTGALAGRTRDRRLAGRTRELGVGRTHPERTCVVVGGLHLVVVGRTHCQTRVRT